MIGQEALAVYNLGLQANRSTDFARIRDLAEEIILLGLEFESCKTYFNSVRLQNRRAEQRALIAGLRSQIRVVVDNSDFF